MTLPTNLPNSGGDLGTFALEWLIWPERVAGRRRHDRLFAAGDPKFGLRSKAFQDRMDTRFRHLKVDDIKAISSTLADNCESREAEGAPVLPWLYRQCMNDAGVTIEFSSGIPVIRCAATRFERWVRLAERIDPDALVCLALASQFPNRELDDAAARVVATWPIVFSPADHDLKQLMSKGVTDLHLHLKSLWPAALSWQRVLPHAVDRGEGKALKSLPAFKRLDPQSAEWKSMANVVARRPGMFPCLARLRPASVPFFESVDLLPNPIGLLLQSERLMLIHAWRNVLTGNIMRPAIEVELDDYITAKSLFRARHTQPSDTSNKGLMAFDTIRRANSHLGRFDREEASGGGFSSRRFRRNNAFLFLALRDSAALLKTEVRIAPPSVAPKHLTKAYGQTLLATDQLVRSLASAQSNIERPEIKVALHFKRMIPDSADEARWQRANVYPPAMVLLRKLLEFDRDTASFQDFRVRSYEMHAHSQGSEPGSRVRALGRVSRLDLASPERGAGPWLIAPYIRLLKGDTALLEQLALPEARAYFPKWSHLCAQSRARPPLGSPELGLTCHAGEDFYTLVDGLWHIEGALSAWRMGPGDALGHCLALGLDPLRQLDALEQIRIPTGIELDSMIWLRRMAKEIGFGDLAVMHRLEHWILNRAADIYADESGGAGKFRLDLAALEAKVAAGAAPLLVPESYAPSRLPVPIAFADSLPDHVSYADRLRLLDFFDPSVARRRHRRKKPSVLHRDLSELIRHTQNALIDQICTKGIVIETNPSSNMRMERIDLPSRLPVCSMLIRDGGRPRVTICTDNPGTYDANIETEYALMLSALLTIFGPERRDDAIECLERMRAVGHALFCSF